MAKPSWVPDNFTDDPDHEIWQRFLMFPRKSRPRIDFLIREMGIECYAYPPPGQPTIYCIIFPTAKALVDFRELTKKREIELPELDRITAVLQ